MTKRTSTKDKQRSTKHTHETKDRVTRTPLKPGVNSGAPEGKASPAPLENILTSSSLGNTFNNLLTF